MRFAAAMALSASLAGCATNCPAEVVDSVRILRSDLAVVRAHSVAAVATEQPALDRAWGAVGSHLDELEALASEASR